MLPYFWIVFAEMTSALLTVGESCYTHFLDPKSNVIDDTLVYRRSADKYLVVVNASNDDKDWAWLNAVREGKVAVDADRPVGKDHRTQCYIPQSA